jgi:hypothetical protein
MGLVENDVKGDERNTLIEQILNETGMKGARPFPLSLNRRSSPRASSRLRPIGERLITSPKIPVNNPTTTALWSLDISQT